MIYGAELLLSSSSRRSTMIFLSPQRTCKTVAGNITGMYMCLKRLYYGHSCFPVNVIAKTTPSSRHATQIHAVLITGDFIPCPVFFTKLISLYFKCGLTEDCIVLFSTAPCSSKNVVTWTTLISEFTHLNECFKALSFFHQMRSSNDLPNEYTFSAVLHACSGIRVINIGEQIHCLIWKYGFGAYWFVGTTLIDMYSKCDEVESSELVFEEMRSRNLVAWNAMIVAYLHNECFEKAIKLFKDLINRDLKFLCPDEVSFSSVLSACANSGALSFGRQLHGLITKHSLLRLPYVNSSLVDMYCKCFALSDAMNLFRIVDCKYLVCWNVMVAGFYLNEKLDEAISLFCAMIREGVHPDEASYCSALRATGCLGVLLHGNLIHDHAIKAGFSSSVFVAASLIMMYAACGNLIHACNVFAEVKDRNLLCWTAIIVACQQHGCPNQAILLFEKMQMQKIKPSHAAYAAVITACSDLNSINEGISYLNDMIEVHEMTVHYQHYVSLVELLSRAGYLSEALEIIKDAPIKPGSEIWCPLMRICLESKNLEIAEETAVKLLQLDDSHEIYLVLSEFYVLIGMTEKAHEIIDRLKDRDLRNLDNCWMELRNSVFTLSWVDSSHQRIDEIHQTLKTLQELQTDYEFLATD